MVNIQESRSQILLHIAGKQDIPISYEVSNNTPKVTWRMQIYVENPLVIMTFFDIFMRAFLDGLLGLPYGNNDFLPTHKGIFS